MNDGAMSGTIIIFLGALYMLITGKLPLTKNRIVYDTPARLIVLISILPFLGFLIYMAKIRNTVPQPGAHWQFLGSFIVYLLLTYIIGWPLGQPPRQ